MRFNKPQSEYPLPILRPKDFDSDYLESSFDVKIDFFRDSSPHKAEITFDINQKEILDLVKSNKAIVSLAISSLDTYLYELHDLGNVRKQIVTYNEKNLHGYVYFTLIVRAIQNEPCFTLSDLGKGFQAHSFDVRNGDILAISQEYQVPYQLPPIKMDPTFFQLVEQPELEPSAFEIDLQDQKIKVVVGVELNNLIQLNMETELGRLKNISSIYFPVLIDTLYEIKNSSEYEGRFWFEALRLTMSDLNIDINSRDFEPLSTAQKILKFSFAELLRKD
jgi:hypothetical protein